MPFYKKKPVVVEAFLLGVDKEPQWWVDAFVGGMVERGENNDDYVIHTLEGDEVARQRSTYVVQGVRGELYPCRRDIFEETYDVC